MHYNHISMRTEGNYLVDGDNGSHPSSPYFEGDNEETEEPVEIEKYPPEEIGKRKNYVLFISPLNFFGINGYKIYTDTLLEAIWMTDHFEDMYVRVQPLFGKDRRIMFEPAIGWTRPTYGTNKNYVNQILKHYGKAT